MLLAIIGNTQLNLGFTRVVGQAHGPADVRLAGAGHLARGGGRRREHHHRRWRRIAFWVWWSRHRNEPDELMKMAIGSLIAAGGPALMAIAGAIVDTTHGKVGPIWTLAFTILNDIGFANVLRGQPGAVLARGAAPDRGPRDRHLLPAPVVSFSVAGWLAGFMDVWSNRDFWAMHAVLVARRRRAAARSCARCSGACCPPRRLAPRARRGRRARARALTPALTRARAPARGAGVSLAARDDRNVAEEDPPCPPRRAPCTPS